MSNIFENSRTLKLLLLVLTVCSFSAVMLRSIVYFSNTTPNCPSNCTTYGPLNLGGVSWGLNSSHKQILGSSSISKDGSEAIKAFNWTFDTFEETTYVCFMPKRIKCDPSDYNNKSSDRALSMIALGIEMFTFLTILFSLFVFGTWTSTPLYYQSF